MFTRRSAKRGGTPSTGWARTGAADNRGSRWSWRFWGGTTSRSNRSDFSPTSRSAAAWRRRRAVQKSCPCPRARARRRAASDPRGQPATIPGLCRRMRSLNLRTAHPVGVPRAEKAWNVEVRLFVSALCSARGTVTPCRGVVLSRRPHPLHLRNMAPDLSRPAIDWVVAESMGADSCYHTICRLPGPSTPRQEIRARTEHPRGTGRVTRLRVHHAP